MAITICKLSGVWWCEDYFSKCDCGYHYANCKDGDEEYEEEEEEERKAYCGYREQKEADDHNEYTYKDQDVSVDEQNMLVCVIVLQVKALDIEDGLIWLFSLITVVVNGCGG